MKNKSKSFKKLKIIQSMEDSKSISKDCKFCKIAEVFAESPILMHLSHGKNCKSNIIENVKHISVVHEGEKTYECEICDGNFTQLSGLKVHMERIHEKKMPTIECPICGAQLTKSDLAVHVCSIHEGRKLSKEHQNKINHVKSKMMHQFKSEDLTQNGENINPNIIVKQEVDETATDQEAKSDSDPDFIISGSTEIENTGHANTEEIVFADPLDIYENKQRYEKKKNCGESKYKCNTYNAGFTQKISVSKHIEDVHEGKKPHRCSSCGKAFSKRHKMVLHFESVHEGKKPHKCTLCEKNFAQKNQLSAHIMGVHEGKKPFQCDICRSTFKRKAQIKVHIETVHEGKKPFNCNICKSSFSKKGNMKTHLEIVHNGIKPFECNVCQARFSIKRDVKIHKDTVHDNIRAFQCNFCDQTFTQSSSLKTHIKRKHSDGKIIRPVPLDVHIEESLSKGKIPCQYNLCGKSFASKQRLRTHVEAVHEGKKLLVDRLNCDFCDKSFASKQRLNSHVASIHEFEIKVPESDIRLDLNEHSDANDVIIPPTLEIDTAEHDLVIKEEVFEESEKLISDPQVSITKKDSKYFQGGGDKSCKICNKKFAKMYNLKQHIKAVHEGKKPFDCNICEDSFSSKGNMKTHIEIVHDGIKPFACVVCQAKFSLRRDVKIHMDTVHHKIRAFQCNFCNKTYAGAQHLKSHIRTKHSDTNDMISPLNLKIDTAEHDPEIKEEVFEESGYLKSDIQVFITEKDETNATNEHDSENKEELIKEYGKLNSGPQVSITKQYPKFKFQGGEIKSVTCNICHKMFAKKQNLNQHTETVHEENKFGCKICNATFIFEVKLKRHIIAVHEKKKKDQSIESNVKRNRIDVFLPFDGLRKKIALMAIKKRREEIVRKTNFDEMTNKKIYFKRAKEMLCYEQSICMSKDTKYFIISFKARIKALYKKMDGKIDETSDILNDFNMKTFLGETSRTIELAWNKMNDKVMRDWHKLGVKMNLALKAVAKDQGLSEESIDFKFNSINALA